LSSSGNSKKPKDRPALAMTDFSAASLEAHVTPKSRKVGLDQIGLSGLGAPAGEGILLFPDFWHGFEPS
jgi:hypothetical protein